MTSWNQSLSKKRFLGSLKKAMAKKKISKKKLAELMNTSRTQVDRLLDSKSDNITIDTQQRAAQIVGRQLRIELVKWGLWRKWSSVIRTGAWRKALFEDSSEFDPRKYLKPAMEAMTKLVPLSEMAKRYKDGSLAQKFAWE
jgi:transcriptional regulator with XRE-family HTH domain